MSIDWQRVKHLLAEAVARTSPDERAAYLDDACGSDVSLRAQVEKLLKAHDQADTFLEQPARPAPEFTLKVSRPPTEKAGDRIGPYKLLQQIGEGGCGVVYMAEQEHPIRRRVALKVIKLGMDTKSVIARFEAERQALALMDHPNIAHVLDAGATDAGRPYFVMELVRGIKITDYCDQNHLSTEARLNLFVQVCHALQHAHQKGIIHRDIKPSNILVTLHDGSPMPKVIDFGIAKATDQRLTDKTLFTAFEQFIGTPAYMSPEQAAMTSLDIDTRSDIYALGVLLYELLTGRPPFDQGELIAAGLDGMRRIIREEEPKRPSTRLSTLAAVDQTTVAKCRHADPLQLIHQVRGDLDWIVMRCLEKDRTRRYETANSLAEDVLRHLRVEPVIARPPSRLYQFQKLVQRNKAVFGAAGTVLAALVLGLGFSLQALARERAARQQAMAAELKAQTEAGKSHQVAQFLKDMLQGVGPSVALGRDTTLLREILDTTAERVGKDLKEHPQVEAELRSTLGEVYEALGQYGKAEDMYQAAILLQRGLWGNQHTNVADAVDRLGWELLFRRIKIEESEPLLHEAFMIRTNLLSPEHTQIAASQYHLGMLRLWQGRRPEGERLMRQCLDLRRRLLGDQCLEVAESLTGLGQALTDLNKTAEAETALREALAIQARLFPDERATPDAGNTQFWLGLALRRQGKLDEAEAFMRKAVTLRRDLLGENHPNVALAMEGLANVLVAGDKIEEASTVAREALVLCRKLLGEEHPTTAFCWDELGLALRKAGRLAESESAYREALAIWRKRAKLNVDYGRLQLVLLLRDAGKFAEAEVLCRERFEEAKALASAPFLPSTLFSLSEVLLRQNRAAEIEPLVTEAFEAADKLHPPSPILAEQLSLQALTIASLMVWFTNETEHAALCRRTFEWASHQPGAGPAMRAAGIANLRPLADPQLRESARTLARRGLSLAQTNVLRPWFELSLGMAEYRSGHYSDAVLLLSAAELGGPATGRPEVRAAAARFCRAMCLFRQGYPDAARTLFAETGTKMKPPPPAAQWPLTGKTDSDDLLLWIAYREARELLTSDASL